MKPTADTTVTQQIEAAVAALTGERERLDGERAAFGEFRKRVPTMDAHAPAAPTTATVTTAIMGTSPATASSPTLEQVRDAYRETVMSVPHYDEDYGYGLATDLAEEFGPELASALTTTTDPFTPSLKETLLTATSSAIKSRTALLSALDREADTLDTAATTLEEMNTALIDLNRRPIARWSRQERTAGYERLREFEAECDELATDRQVELHSQRVRGPTYTDEHLNEYLYDALPVTYPVLADLADFTGLLRTARQRLERALIIR